MVTNEILETPDGRRYRYFAESGGADTEPLPIAWSADSLLDLSSALSQFVTWPRFGCSLQCDCDDVPPELNLDLLHLISGFGLFGMIFANTNVVYF